MADKRYKHSNKKKLEGFRGHVPIKLCASPRPLGIVPNPPDWLKLPRSVSFWERMAPVLVKHKLLTKIDLSSFEMLCYLYGRVFQLEDKIFRSRTLRDRQKLNTELRRTRAEFGEWLKMFGMFGPASRDGLDIHWEDIQQREMEY